MSNNPLEKLYRSKSFFLPLPSTGRYYDSGINLSVDNEIGVMPMTAADEIKLKSPDTLFNGEALYELFRSCVPDIVNPEEIPICDVDKLLLAIRIAGAGPNIDIDTKCPECEETETYQIDLRSIMNTAKDIPDNDVVEISDTVSIQIKPLTLKSQVKNQLEVFYQIRMQQLINESDSKNEAQAKLFDEALVQAIAIQTAQIADCIANVVLDKDTDDEIVVTDYDHIFAWVENMDKETHHKIKAQLNDLSESHMNSNVQLECPKCKHKYKSIVDLNPVNFF